MHILIAIIPNSSPNPIFDHLLESSHRDDSNNGQTLVFGELGIIEIKICNLRRF